MPWRLIKFFKLLMILILVVAATLLGTRLYRLHSYPPLELWHTFVPDEMHASQIDKTDWAGYIKAENAIFEAIRKEVTQKLDKKDRIPVNRYFAESPVYPGHFKTDWNHSYILETAAAPVGAVVFLHGLTDTPYSLRHIARRYRDHGFVSIAIRLPAHGTVPGALTDVKWEDWLAATRLAVREARRRIGPSRPLHIVGFSNGGALALKYAMDAIEDPALTKPSRVILISPMIGITRFARFAGMAGLPAVLPAFAKAAWLSIVPEFNPFKYNSFPVNAARQTWQLTSALQQRITNYANQGKLVGLPPVITFQSVMDFTVSTRAVISAFYEHLPANNGSELVLFDVNRAAKLGLLLRPTANTALDRLLQKPPRNFRTTIITNADVDNEKTIERITEAGSVKEKVRALDLLYPSDIYSLSHVALPFPMNDPLYGLQPDATEPYGIELGAIATRGERNALIVSMDFLLRLSSNPFFPYLLERIEEGMQQSGQ